MPQEEPNVEAGETDLVRIDKQLCRVEEMAIELRKKCGYLHHFEVPEKPDQPEEAELDAATQILG